MPINPSLRSQVRQLFRFLKAFAERSAPPVRTLSKHPWTMGLDSLPKHPCIELGHVESGPVSQAESADVSDREFVLRVRRPRLTPAPSPGSILRDWVERGWETPSGEARVILARNELRNGQTVTVQFVDDPQRPAELHRWKLAWSAWSAAERPAHEAMRVFEALFSLHGRMALESEKLELLVGDGRLRWSVGTDAIDHPILLQRVDLLFDPAAPEFTVVDADRPPELFAAVLMGERGVSPMQMKQLRDELDAGGYHPLAGSDTSGFLQRVTQTLDSRGRFVPGRFAGQAGADPVVAREPALFLRSRASGFPDAFDAVLEDLERTEGIPASLQRLVGTEPAPTDDEVLDAPQPWNEPPDVLLSKPANPEQIKIARALDRHHAVLVQGPPGTGKSHTIANLIGHLVAQGKRVLVTSHTTKALRVLRGHVEESLRPLCVAVLDNDAESRLQLEQSVRDILARLTTADAQALATQATRLKEQRAALIESIDKIVADLKTAREAEYTPLTFGGESTPPSEAARWVHQNAGEHDWIPAPIEAGGPLPLAAQEVVELYATNAAIGVGDESECAAGLPAEADVCDEQEFARLVEQVQRTPNPEFDRFWGRSAVVADRTVLASACESAGAAVEEYTRLEAWQRDLVAAGHLGPAATQVWTDLCADLREARDTWERCHPILAARPVELGAIRNVGDVRQALPGMQARAARGKGFSFLTRLMNPGWGAVLHHVRVAGKPPNSGELLEAVAAHLELVDSRERFGTHWDNVAVKAGLPSLEAIGTPFEPALADYKLSIEHWLGWWGARWSALESPLDQSGFTWAPFKQAYVNLLSSQRPLERDLELLGGKLLDGLRERIYQIEAKQAGDRLRELEDRLAPSEAEVGRRLRNAVRKRSVEAHTSAYAELKRLLKLVPVWRRRRELLEKLRTPASAWCSKVGMRLGVHGAAQPPGNAALAWQWLQWHQELERRAKLNVAALARRLEQSRTDLQRVTTELIDASAWLGQLKRTDLVARQSLQGWVDTQKKIGRGTGKRAPQLREEARRLLEHAREAVPVWIMPLVRVAESFRASSRRFDVVIVDEASQSDVSGLLAWYLGAQIVVVGDHEQVSPLDVGTRLDDVSRLIAQYLQGIPNAHLYDGRTSIYDLGRQCFGGTIALREHFRCVPDIIEFSNGLCYNFEIRPLRNPATAKRPHVVEYHVGGVHGSARAGKSNEVEASFIAALLKAATELPEYEGKSVGAITLLGDEQAVLINEKALALVGAVELARRKFVAGNSAQFQGDERDVMFLSMVDVPGDGPLRLRQEDSLRQRYNVAASRARDQMWLVHSLNPNTDLKEGDLRRRLIEHVRDPGAWANVRQKAAEKAESPFEVEVLNRLLGAGYRVEPQVWIGRYRVDFVVGGQDLQVVIECDGDRYHGVDKIPEDMARQAILERVGWKFVRIRGSRFYRDPDGAMAWVFDQLGKLDVKPDLVPAMGTTTEANGDALDGRVKRRAWEIMREQGWINGSPSQPLS